MIVAENIIQIALAQITIIDRTVMVMAPLNPV